MSEFELSLLRQLSEEAIREKARRGELQFLLPVGLCRTSSGKIEKDPDQRVQQAMQLVFRKMAELGSVRRVLLWSSEEKVCLPAFPRDPGERKMIWKLPVYSNIRAILTNPLYAGAYAFGKTETRTHLVNGRARKTVGHPKPRREWAVLIQDHHLGYISWQEYERNQALMAANNHMQSGVEPKAGRGGRALTRWPFAVPALRANAAGLLYRDTRGGDPLSMQWCAQATRGRAVHCIWWLASGCGGGE